MHMVIDLGACVSRFFFLPTTSNSALATRSPDSQCSLVDGTIKNYLDPSVKTVISIFFCNPG